MDKCILYSKASATIAAILLSISLFIGWLPIMCYAANSPEPDVPLITYGEFPFTVVYEVNGEEHIIKDTVICEYAGSRWNEGDGKKHRIWDRRFESGEYCVLYTVSEHAFIVLGLGRTTQYLMGDTEDNPQISDAYPQVLEYFESGTTSLSSPNEDEVFDTYGIRIISFETAPPIENTFVPAE